MPEDEFKKLCPQCGAHDWYVLMDDELNIIAIGCGNCGYEEDWPLYDDDEV